jgi:SAM-dependent methyltransferase
MKLLDQRRYWNRVGPGKAFTHPLNVARVTALLPLESRILDYGCGYGRVLGELRHLGYWNLSGVDSASAMITAARAKVPEIAFQELQSPPQLPFADNSFDAALLFAVLTCVPPDDAQRAIIREIRRVLRYGGLLYISDFWLQTDPRNTERYARDHNKYGAYGVFDLPEGVTVRHHERKWIEELTREFETVALDEIQLETMNGNLAAGFQWFGRK